MVSKRNSPLNIKSEVEERQDISWFSGGVGNCGRLVYITVMMRTLIFLELLLLACLPSANALEPKEIKELAKAPHDRKGLLVGLEIFPDDRTYQVKVTITKPDGSFLGEGKASVKEKVVRGRYLVSVFKPPNLDEEMIRVVTFEKETSSYRCWVLSPDNGLAESIGISLQGSRTVRWTNIPDPNSPGKTELSVETHIEGRSTWFQSMMEEGEVRYLMKVEAER